MGPTWRDRLRLLTLAGGALSATTACTAFPCGNANPDPCICGRPDDLQEEARRAFGAMEQQIAAPALRRLEANAPFEPAHAALGVLAPEARVEAFYATVE